MMAQYADWMIYDKNGQLVLIAEAKYKYGTSPDWAAQLRRNMYAHGLLPAAPYFLLALPDHFYLWANRGETLEVEAVAPDFSIDPAPFLTPLYKRLGVSPHHLTGQSFGLIVTSWLHRVLTTDSPQDLQGENQEWLLVSGLFDALKGGNLLLEAAA